MTLARRRRRGVPRLLYRFVPFAAFSGLGAAAAVSSEFVLAALLGAGAAWSGFRLLDKKGNERRRLWQRVRENARQLEQVARADAVAAPQMRRISGLQNGLVEGWEMLPESRRPLLIEDMFAIMDEVEGAAQLAHRRSVLRRHLEGVNRGMILKRIRDLEKDLKSIEPGSPLRVSFESALEGRRGELAAYDTILPAISAINAQLEAAESLLGNLQGDVLTLETGLAGGSLESGLGRLRQRVALYRESLDEVSRGLESLEGRVGQRLPEDATERLPVR